MPLLLAAEGGYQEFVLKSSDKFVLLFSGVTALLAIAVGFFLAKGVLAADQGTPKMIEIATAIQEGALAYLKRQMRTIVVILIPLAAIVFLTSVKVVKPDGSEALSFVQSGLFRTLAFLAGCTMSGLTGFIGMSLATQGNVRTAAAAKTGSLPAALQVAFRTGGVAGMFTVGLGLLGATVIITIFQNTASAILIGFGFGGSLLALFLRVGGGIFTKAADVGADLVGKVEAGIPEDDPRNPATIAHNVGDNVGDCAGMAADLFETYAITAVAVMLLGTQFPAARLHLYPLPIGAVSILASVIGTWFARIGRGDNAIINALYKAVLVATILSAIGFIPVTLAFDDGPFTFWDLYLAALVGLIVTFLLVAITEYYTGTRWGPVKSISRASQTGHATNIIEGLAVGMQATAAPVIVIAAGILIANRLSGLYGIGVAVMAQLSMTGLIVALDAYGPVTDNAGGIAEMADLPPEVRAITDPLDAVGNTTKAVTKGYAIGSAALAALILFDSYTTGLHEQGAGHGSLGTLTFDLSNAWVIAGLFIGGLVPFPFAPPPGRDPGPPRGAGGQ